MIPFRWLLLQYQSGNGRKAIEDWRKGLPVGLPRADLDTFLRQIAKKDKWEYPDIDGLKGKKYRGLSELRWKSGNVPHRIIGYTQADHLFVMLIGCTHNKKKYDPTDALDTAAKRKKKIEDGEAGTCEYKLITDSGDAEQGV
jgi:hypothetical protein